MTNGESNRATALLAPTKIVNQRNSCRFRMCVFRLLEYTNAQYDHPNEMQKVHHKHERVENREIFVALKFNLSLGRSL